MLRILSCGLVLIASIGFAAEHTKDSLEEVKKAVVAGKALIVDVREKDEWDSGHLADAKLVPLSLLKKDAKSEAITKQLSKDKVLYLHCGSGVRCLKAADLLKSQGYDVRPLNTGFSGLVEAGFKEAQK